MKITPTDLYIGPVFICSGLLALTKKNSQVVQSIVPYFSTYLYLQICKYANTLKNKKAQQSGERHRHLHSEHHLQCCVFVDMTALLCLKDDKKILIFKFWTSAA